VIYAGCDLTKTVLASTFRFNADRIWHRLTIGRPPRAIADMLVGASFHANAIPIIQRWRNIRCRSLGTLWSLGTSGSLWSLGTLGTTRACTARGSRAALVALGACVLIPRGAVACIGSVCCRIKYKRTPCVRIAWRSLWRRKSSQFYSSIHDNAIHPQPPLFCLRIRPHVYGLRSISRRRRLSRGCIGKNSIGHQRYSEC